MARKVTMKAFEAWIAVEGNEARVLELIAGGTTLQKASLAVKQPYTCLHPHFHSSPEIQARYDAARKSWADFKNDRLLEKAENVVADRDEIAKVKLQAEVIANQSKRYYREAWGDTVKVDRGAEVPGDRALLGFASELLKLVKQPAEREVKGQVVAEQLPEKVRRG